MGAICIFYNLWSLFSIHLIYKLSSKSLASPLPLIKSLISQYLKNISPLNLQGISLRCILGDLNHNLLVKEDWIMSYVPIIKCNYHKLGVYLFMGHSITNLTDTTLNLPEYRWVISHAPWQSWVTIFAIQKALLQQITSHHSTSGPTPELGINKILFHNSQINNSTFQIEACIVLVCYLDQLLHLLW